MKLLFDQNLSFRLCHLLVDLFPDSTQVRLVGLDQAEDSAIRNYAATYGFAIVTQDIDFYRLALLHGIPPKIVWLRCGNQPTAVIAGLLREHAAELQAFADDSALACLELY